MKLFTGWVLSAGLVLTAAAANAQGSRRSRRPLASYGRYPTSAGPMRRCRRTRRCRRLWSKLRPNYGPNYGPRLLPPQEVYSVVREGGFSPLGVPRLRGYVLRHRGGRSPRRRRAPGDRRPQRADRALHAGLSDGRQFPRGCLRLPAAPLSPMGNSGVRRGRRLPCRSWRAACRQRCRCRRPRRRAPRSRNAAAIQTKPAEPSRR